MDYLSSSSTSNQSNININNSRRFQMGTRKRKAGSNKFKETRHPVYNGVRWRNGKWVTELRPPGNNKSRIWLGTFPSPDMAARAYDVAAFALRGESARLNFPESARLLPQARSTSIKDIRRAAIEAADQMSSSNGGHGVEQVEFQYSSCSSAEVEGGVGSSRMVFLDEEELFNMPALLDSMAEGMIVTPPGMKKGFSWNDAEEEENSVEFTLWSD